MKLEDLDDWQKEVLEYKGDFLLCTGRRVGKTQIMAIKAAQRLVNQKGCQIIVASLTEDQAQLIIIMVLDFLERNYKAYLKKAKKPTKNSVSLNNGSQILARPVGNTGDALRGFNGHVLILDEVSRFNELILLAATPILLTTGGEIWLCSTPFGKQGFFWKQFDTAYNKQLPDARFKVFYKSSEDVIYNRKISESWTEETRIKAIKFLEDEKRDKTALEYGQEYLGLFIEDLQRLFDDKLIEMRCVGQTQPRKEQGKYFLGVDVARMGGDEITFQIVELLPNNKIIHVESIVKKMQLTTKTTKDILDLNSIYNFKRIYVDGGGIGAAILDQLLIEAKTRNKVEAINNASKSLDNEDKKKRLLKVDLYMNLLRLMERGDVTLLNDDKVILSLRSVQYENVIKPDESSTVRIFGNYTHIVEGLIRACWCVTQKSLNLYVYWR